MKTTHILSDFGYCTTLPVCVIQDWSQCLVLGGVHGPGDPSHTDHIPQEQAEVNCTPENWVQRTQVRENGRGFSQNPPSSCLVSRARVYLPLAWFMVSAFSLMHSFFPDFLLSFHLLTREGLLGRKHHAWVKGEQLVLRCWGSLECGGCIVVPELPPCKIWSDMTPSKAGDDIHHFLPQQKVLIKETFPLMGQLATEFIGARFL